MIFSYTGNKIGAGAQQGAKTQQSAHPKPELNTLKGTTYNET